MGFLDRVFGTDHERAAKYSGPSATETAAVKRRTGHRRSAATADRAGPAWEERDRARYPSSTKWFRRR